MHFYICNPNFRLWQFLRCALVTPQVAVTTDWIISFLLLPCQHICQKSVLAFSCTRGYDQSSRENALHRGMAQIHGHPN
ncbi:hypothetical protein T4B_2997 [Trichinella pseudospiralis]|uniref:Uncharacterized protein n=1 Tax=Trichinella pseudospiralis TaxID=6337 RepID=A0A0V1EJU3_TRIPS|nr:hypothetical protein T4A_5879 [Trichinella pseudospiralis]KRZ33719.1 hypothetical protein T4B_2997 [Trichinella pseudospiralis]